MNNIMTSLRSSSSYIAYSERKIFFATFKNNKQRAFKAVVIQTRRDEFSKIFLSFLQDIKTGNRKKGCYRVITINNNRAK